MTQLISGYSERQLLARAIYVAKPKRHATAKRFIAVMDTFSIDENEARELCRAFGFDDNEDLKKERATGCLHPNCTCDDYCKAEEPYEKPTLKTPGANCGSAPDGGYECVCGQCTIGA